MKEIHSWKPCEKGKKKKKKNPLMNNILTISEKRKEISVKLLDTQKRR